MIKSSNSFVQFDNTKNKSTMVKYNCVRKKDSLLKINLKGQLKQK